jgi:hypothetical protein
MESSALESEAIVNQANKAQSGSKLSAAFHNALEQTLNQAGRIDGTIGTIYLGQRYSKEGGHHVHCSVSVRQTIRSTVQVDGPNPLNVP